MIKVEVHSTRAVIRSQEPLTVGLRGAKAWFTFGTGWAQLIKTAVFRQGEKTVTVADIGEEVTIPWEVLTLPGVPVQIGVYGIDEAGAIAIPTLWTQTDPVRPGADPKGDPSTAPTPGLWEQIQGNMGSLEQLNTDEKSSLVAAINEANRPVFLVTVYSTGDGTYASDCDVEKIRAKMDANVPVACYWYEKDAVLPLVGFQLRHTVAFAAVDHAVEYQVVFDESGVNCHVIDLLTKAPVTSVNGQKGDVHLTIPTVVSQLVNDRGYLTKAVYLVTLDSSNRAEQSFDDIMAAYRAGYDVKCSYKGYLLPLKLEPDTECVFSGTVDTTVYSVVVHSNRDASVFERSLAQKKDIPSKTSQLENDSGFLTTVPVTSVNGQTGDVTVPTAVKVTVTDDGNGNYAADLSCSAILENHNAGSVVYCQWGNRVLSLLAASKAFCAFGCVHSGNVYTVTVSASSVSVSTTPMTSGTVKTVNGIAPDENGNVEISVSGDNGDSGNTPTVEPVALSIVEGSYNVNTQQLVPGADGHTLNNYITEEIAYYDNLTIHLLSDDVIVRVIYFDKDGNYLDSSAWMSRTKTNYSAGGVSVYTIENAYAYIAFADPTKDVTDISYTVSHIEMLARVSVRRVSNSGVDNDSASSPFQGKKLLTFGDSITWLNDNGRVGYQTNLQNNLGLSGYLNKGVSGASISTASNALGYTPIVNTVSSFTDFDEYDLITVFGGTNDFKMNASIGDIGAIGDTEFDTTTFYGGYRAIIEHILTAKPTARLLLITPLQRNKDDYNGWNTTNQVGHSLKDYVDAVKTLGQMYSLPVVDLFAESGFNQFTLSTFTYDGLHPNNDGFVRVANCIAGEMVRCGL